MSDISESQFIWDGCGSLSAASCPKCITQLERLRVCHKPCRDSCMQYHEVLKHAGAAEDGTEAIVAEAHKFLQEQGCINFGVPHGEPAEEEQPVEEGVSDEDLQTAVFEVLRMVDITVRQPDFISSALHQISPMELDCTRRQMSPAEQSKFLDEKVPSKRRM